MGKDSDKLEKEIEELGAENRALSERLAEIERRSVCDLQVFESSPIPTVVLDGELRVLRQNSAALSLDPEGFVGLNFGDVLRVVHADRTELVEVLIGNLSNPEVDSFSQVIPHRSRTGQPRTLQFSFKRFVNEGRHRIVGFAQDITDAAALENTLRAREHRFKNILESLPVAVYSRTAEGQITYVSSQIEAISGYPVSHFLTDWSNWASIIVPEDLEPARTLIMQAHERFDPFELEYRIVSSSGEVRWLRDSARPVRDDTGLITYQGVLQDISEQVRVSQALIASEEQHRSLIESLPGATYRVDPTTRQPVFVSPQVEQITGFTREELIRSPQLVDLQIHPEDRDRVIGALTDDSGSPKSYETEYRFCRKDGSTIWVNDRGAVHWDAKLSRYVRQGFVQDVTDRVEAAQELARSRALYQNLVEQSPYAVYRVRIGSSTMEYASPMVEQITGYSAERWMTDQALFANIVLPEDRPKVFRLSGRTTSEGEPFDCVYRIKRADGVVRWVHDRSHVVPDPTGESKFLQGTVEDVTDRIEMFERLKLSEHRFRVAVESSGIMVFNHDPLMRYTWMENPIVDAGNVLGKTDVEILGVEEGQRLYNLKKSVFDTGIGCRIEYELDIRGEKRIYDLFIEPVFDGLEPIGLTCVAIDITDNVRSREALELSRRELAETQEAGKLGGWSVDRELNVRWTREMFHMFGLDPDGPEPSFEQVGEMLHPEDRESNRRLFDRAWSSGESAEAEYRLYRADGKLRHIRATFNSEKDDDGKVVRVFGTALDVTAIREAYDALRSSEARLRKVLDSMFVFVGVLTPDGVLSEVNEAPLKAAGVPRETVVGGAFWQTPWWRGLPEEQSRLRAAIKSAADGRSTRWDAVNRLAGGLHIWVDVTVSPILGLDGTVAEIIVSGVDISERVEAEAEIRRLNATLEQRVRDRTAALESANKEMESFSYSVSHDLRSPLRAMTGYSQILLEDHADELSEDSKDCLRKVMMSARRMGDLIDDLLTLSRLGRKPLEIRVVDPNRIVEDIRQEARAGLDGRTVEIAIEKMPTVDTDSGLLTQVFSNLISNAVKFTAGSDEARIRIGSMEQQGETVFFVQDNGIGFEMRYSERIFRVFERLESDPRYPGTGIGLAIVDRVLRRIGGRIWVDSRPGSGTTFWFTVGQPE